MVKHYWLGENCAVQHIAAALGLPAEGVTFIEILSPAAKLTELVRSKPVVAVPEIVQVTGVSAPFLRTIKVNDSPLPGLIFRMI